MVAGIIALEAVSLVVAVGLSLLERRRFDYRALARVEGELETVARDRAPHPAIPHQIPAPEPAAG